MEILGYLKNTHKNPKYGRVRQVPTRELGWEFPGWDFGLTLPNLGFLWVFYKYPKIFNNGNLAVLAQSVERVDCRAGRRGFDSWGWTNTQGLKTTEK